MRDFIIYAKDYVNLSETLSGKNIINAINGKEYAIGSTKKTEINNTKIDPETLKKIFATTPYNNDNAKFNNSLIVDSDDSITGVFVFIRSYTRTESLFIQGSYVFSTNQVITDFNSINCEFKINYTKSQVDWIDKTNYSIQNRTSFFQNNKFPILAEEDVPNNGIYETNNFLEVESGTSVSYPSIFDNVLSFIDYFFSKGYAKIAEKNEYVRPKIISKNDDGTTIQIDYCFRVWGAWVNSEEWDFVHKQNGNALCVNSIEISTFADSVDTVEIPFEYRKENVSVEKNYELETNELFQNMYYNIVDVNSTTEGTYYIKNEYGVYSEVTLPEDYQEGKVYYKYDFIPTEERLSYKTFEEITDKYDVDRRIITFDLLNPIKLKMYDSQKYEKGKDEERYLDCDDEFSIYDEYNKYIGDFKVIKSNPIWDGSYHKIITAILID